MEQQVDRGLDVQTLARVGVFERPLCVGLVEAELLDHLVERAVYEVDDGWGRGSMMAGLPVVEGIGVAALGDLFFGGWGAVAAGEGDGKGLRRGWGGRMLDYSSG